MTNDNLRDLLRKEFRKAGGQRAWAARYGVNRKEICDMISGRRKVSERVMNILGYEWAIVPKKPKPIKERYCDLPWRGY